MSSSARDSSRTLNPTDSRSSNVRLNHEHGYTVTTANVDVDGRVIVAVKEK